MQVMIGMLHVTLTQTLKCHTPYVIFIVGNLQKLLRAFTDRMLKYKANTTSQPQMYKKMDWLKYNHQCFGITRRPIFHTPCYQQLYLK